MLKEVKHFIAGIGLISIVFVSCNSNNDDIVEVKNSSPKFVDKKYVDLEKLIVSMLHK